MAENSIDLVRAAEAEAERMIREAQQQANSALEAARAEAARLAETAKETAEAKAKRDLADAQGTNQTALEGASKTLDVEMEALQQSARSRQPEAIRIILDSLA